MATQLEQILTFTAVPAGGQATLSHNLNWTGRAVKPDLLFRDNGVFSIISTTANQITVQNNSLVAETLNLYVWSLHTLIRAFGGSQFTSLNPMPFIPAAGGNGGGQIAAISAGTQVANTGTIVLSNSNGISFGMSNSSVITASYNALTAFVDGTVTATGPTLIFNNGNGITFGISGNTITGSVQTAGGTATGVGISAGTEVATTGAVIFSNSNGVTFGMHNQTVTASYSQSTAPGALAAGTQTATSGTIVFSNSNGITFGLSGSTRVTASADYIRSISAGTTNATGNQIIFSNSNNVSFGVAGATITGSIQSQPSAAKIVNYSATGGETDFSITMAAVANTNYGVFAQNAGVGRMPVWDLPLGTANRALTAFRAIPSGSLSSGDVIQFFLFAS